MASEQEGRIVKRKGDLIRPGFAGICEGCVYKNDINRALLLDPACNEYSYPNPSAYYEEDIYKFPGKPDKILKIRTICSSRYPPIKGI